MWFSLNITFIKNSTTHSMDKSFLVIKVKKLATGKVVDKRVPAISFYENSSKKKWDTTTEKLMELDYYIKDFSKILAQEFPTDLHNLFVSLEKEDDNDPVIYLNTFPNE